MDQRCSLSHVGQATLAGQKLIFIANLMPGHWAVCGRICAMSRAQGLYIRATAKLALVRLSGKSAQRSDAPLACGCRILEELMYARRTVLAGEDLHSYPLRRIF